MAATRRAAYPGVFVTEASREVLVTGASLGVLAA